MRNGGGEIFIENKESVLKGIVEEFDLNSDEAALNKKNFLKETDR